MRSYVKAQVNLFIKYFGMSQLLEAIIDIVADAIEKTKDEEFRNELVSLKKNIELAYALYKGRYSEDI